MDEGEDERGQWSEGGVQGMACREGGFLRNRCCHVAHARTAKAPTERTVLVQSCANAEGGQWPGGALTEALYR